jgi:hypothetical protein
MKIFIYSPYLRTGGPENLHQYCDMMNLLGYDAYMYYWHVNAPATIPLSRITVNPSAPPIYSEKYSHLKRAVRVEDSADNLLIIPEIISIVKIRESFPLIRVAIAWLSCLSGLPLQDEYFANPDLIHLFQSYWAKTHVLAVGPSSLITYDVGDYISDEYMIQTWTPHQKENLVAYNPVKDNTTPCICNELGIESLPICDMDSIGVMNALKRCKVYVDLGTHPGRDRIPREAALMGCVVVTNLKGAAAYREDIMVDTRSDSREEQMEFIKMAVTDHAYMINKQAPYVKAITEQKKKFALQIYALVNKSKNYPIINL